MSPLNHNSRKNFRHPPPCGWWRRGGYNLKMTSDIAAWLRFSVHADARGSLVALEKNGGLPFAPVRVYYIYEPRGVRGCHAYRDLEQVVVCLRGGCTVLLDDGETRRDYRLESPDCGLHIKPIQWGEMRDFSDDCLLLVLASAPYDAADYIHDYDAFLQAVAER